MFDKLMNWLNIESPYEFIILVASCLSLLVSFLSYIKARSINKNQISKELNFYLLETIASTFAILEADMVLLNDGVLKKLDKGEVDKNAVNAISKCKSYALITNRHSLFEYLNTLLTVSKKDNIGLLIDRYFEERAKLLTAIRKKDPDLDLLKKEFVKKMKADIQSCRNSMLKRIKELTKTKNTIPFEEDNEKIA